MLQLPEHLIDRKVERVHHAILALVDDPCGFTADVETRRLVEVGQAYLDLLNGKITAGPSDTSFMPGCR